MRWRPITEDMADCQTTQHNEIGLLRLKIGNSGKLSEQIPFNKLLREERILAKKSKRRNKIPTFCCGGWGKKVQAYVFRTHC